MSERSCENCRPGETCGCHAFLHTVALTEATYSEACRRVAAVCKHYAEREELCGALHPKPGNNTGLLSCCLPQSHSGQHFAEITPTASLFWDNIIRPPTPLEKAWTNRELSGDMSYIHSKAPRNEALVALGVFKAEFRAGWRALWNEVKMWGSACQKTDPVDVRAFRSFMASLDAEAECK